MLLSAVIDCMSRRPLNRFHDLNQRHHDLSPLVDARCKNQMYVIGHDDGHVQIVFRSVIVTATPEYDIACPIGQNPAAPSNKRDEMGFEVALQAR